jgi:hypothetical protein
VRAPQQLLQAVSGIWVRVLWVWVLVGLLVRLLLPRAAAAVADAKGIWLLLLAAAVKA